MMSGIDSRKPYSAHDNGKRQPKPTSTTRPESIKQGNYHIGGMQRRYRSKDIGITAVQPMKDRKSRHLIKASQPSHIARCVENRFETIMHDIPGWSCRMNIITDKTQQIDKEKYQCKMKIDPALARKIKSQPEQDRHRHPAQVKHSCHKIHNRTMVNRKKFIRCQYPLCSSNAEEMLLGFVQSFHINRINLIVRHDTHPVIRYGKNDKRQ